MCYIMCMSSSSLGYCLYTGYCVCVCVCVCACMCTLIELCLQNDDYVVMSWSKRLFVTGNHFAVYVYHGVYHLYTQ